MLPGLAIGAEDDRRNEDRAEVIIRPRIFDREGRGNATIEAPEGDVQFLREVSVGSGTELFALDFQRRVRHPTESTDDQHRDEKENGKGCTIRPRKKQRMIRVTLACGQRDGNQFRCRHVAMRPHGQNGVQIAFFHLRITQFDST